ncbi:MAG: hypothetical protein QGI34_16165, partial [Candidatus Latescibacteria bacterium]|nr:hypothetical protein [Candidatus Latescibacterota bacterium]
MATGKRSKGRRRDRRVDAVGVAHIKATFNNTIVTLADANYFELLHELINSIKNYNESKNVSICVLDAGLK